MVQQADALVVSDDPVVVATIAAATSALGLREPRHRVSDRGRSDAANAVTHAGGDSLGLCWSSSSSGSWRGRTRRRTQSWSWTGRRGTPPSTDVSSSRTRKPWCCADRVPSGARASCRCSWSASWGCAAGTRERGAPSFGHSFPPRDRRAHAARVSVGSVLQATDDGVHGALPLPEVAQPGRSVGEGAAGRRRDLLLSPGVCRLPSDLRIEGSADEPGRGEAKSLPSQRRQAEAPSSPLGGRSSASARSATTRTE